MSDNPAKYEVVIKHYLHSILDISVYTVDGYNNFMLGVNPAMY